MTPEATADLSTFYQHALDYSQYVNLAYGLSALVLAVLVVSVLAKHRSLKKDLAYFEGRS